MAVSKDWQCEKISVSTCAADGASFKQSRADENLARQSSKEH